MGEQLAQQGQGRLDPVDRALERGPARLVERAGETAVAVGDDLGDEGVEGPVDPGASTRWVSTRTPGPLGQVRPVATPCAGRSAPSGTFSYGV